MESLSHGCRNFKPLSDLLRVSGRKSDFDAIIEPKFVMGLIGKQGTFGAGQ